MRSNPNVIGRMCVVLDNTCNTLVEAMVIDRDPSTNKAKRIRLQTGEHFGEVRMPSDYKLIEFCEPGEAPGFIAAAWS